MDGKYIMQSKGYVNRQFHCMFLQAILNKSNLLPIPFTDGTNNTIEKVLRNEYVRKICCVMIAYIQDKYAHHNVFL